MSVRVSMIETVITKTTGQGLYEITSEVSQAVSKSGSGTGLCTLFVRHTSASLIIQENADFSVTRDLTNWVNRLVPEHDPLYTHTAEGPDDMPAHIKSMITQTSIAIPIMNGRLALGTWQGVFLFEHRHQDNLRETLVHVSYDTST